MRLLLALAVVAGCADDPGGTCELAVETGAGHTTEVGAATVIYLNRGGATLSAGSDDAARGVSSIVQTHRASGVTIAPSGLSDTGWTELVSCVRAAYAQFNVEIVDQRPQTPGYVMAVFGGSGSTLGLGADSHGIAPTSCETVDDAVVFVFTDNLGNDAARACEVAAHEIAHVFSADHQLLASDLTSYLPFHGKRAFQDLDALCGETAERPCACDRPSQNTVELLRERLGVAPDLDATPPTIDLTVGIAPRGARSIVVHADDPTGVAAVTLTYRDAAGSFSSTCGDGQVPCTTFNGTRTFIVPPASGTAVYSAEATDLAGNRAATVPTVEGAPGSFAIEADRSASEIVVHAAIDATEATLFWTDAHGITTRHAMCESAGLWSVPVTLAATPGQRSAVVQITDRNGQMSIATRLVTI